MLAVTFVVRGSSVEWLLLLIDVMSAIFRSLPNLFSPASVVMELLAVVRLLLLLSFATAAATPTDFDGRTNAIYIRFRSPTELHRLAADPTTGSLYVGATNWLYRIDPSTASTAAPDGGGSDLRPVEAVEIGPRPDHELCTEKFGEQPCGGGTARHNTKITDNVVKVLVVDSVNGRLVTCGSIFQGICDTHSLSNLSLVDISDYGRGNTDFFVAANSPLSSATTVAFVGRGPDRRPVLYVGTTYTGADSTSVRQTVPAVSSRSLDGSTPGAGSQAGAGRFRLTHVDGLTGGGTLVRLRSEAIDKFRISYVAGFESPPSGEPGFAHFLTVQPDGFKMENYGMPPTVSAERSSRIVRVCESDRSFYSYVEMPIRCRTNPSFGTGVDGSTTTASSSPSSAPVEYNLTRAAVLVRAGTVLAAKLGISANDHVLVGVFSASAPSGSGLGGGGQRDRVGNSFSNRSAVCLYRYADIRRKFTENIRRCFSGEQRQVGLQFGNRVCVSQPGMRINDSYCGEVEHNGPLVGTVAVEATPIATFPSTQLTAVAATDANGHMVISLGTADGRLMKMTLHSNGTWRQYSDDVIDAGFPVNRDMLVGENASSLFVMTTNVLTKVPLYNCNQFLTCDTCRASGDPHCGWCSLERRCTAKSSCLDADQDDRWLSLDAWECIRVPHQFVNPSRISIGSSVQVAVGIKALPQLVRSDKYLCVFGANGTVVSGVVSPNEVRCKTPATFDLPRNSDHANVTLFIRSTRTGIDFVNTRLTFYNCSKHNSCTSCSRSTWGCVWCTDRNICTSPEYDSQCAVTAVTEPQMCPRLTHVTDASISLPFNVSVEIPLTAANLPLTVNDFECLVHLTTPAVRVPARRLSASAIVCETFSYTYEADEPHKTVSLEVVWNGDYLVDDNHGITVTVYRCDVMARDCSTCLSLRESPFTAHYSCQWCGQACVYNGSCTDVDGVPLQPVNSCPRARIHEVQPLSGPLEGGTRVTIKGMNLGRSFQQVRDAVTVAGVLCDVISAEYIISRQIICRTGGHSSGTLTGDVVVTIGDASVTWHTQFTYRNPDVMDVFPIIGPKAGGTRVTVEGSNLNTGGLVTVLIGNATCAIDSVSANGQRMTCLTTPVESSTRSPVSVHFDEVSRRPNIEFEYTENPTITKITPLSTYISGGRTITVSGDNFHSVSIPMMHLSNEEATYSSECKVVESGRLLCPSPALLQPRRASRSVRSPFAVSFTMDGVDAMRDLPRNFPGVNSTLVAVADPVYDSFDGGKKTYMGEALILTGRNLNSACRMDEVTVVIGNATCKVNSLESNRLYCSPPVAQPAGLPEERNQLPLVKVFVGNLKFDLGRLEYQKFGGDAQWVIVVVAAGCGGALLTAIAVVLAVCKYKSTRAERQFTKLQMQLDVLESNIRHECKQAFAELQTEVIDFTSDINVIGIPFWDYRTYTFKVLFPSHNDHPILHPGGRKTSTSSNHHDDHMSAFFQLLNVNQFLLIFIQTLEEQRSFTMKDKSMVASLLTVIFRDRMEYLTEILKVLLDDLIDRSVEQKMPKLMLRRTESVVEKLLTNWLSLCMYPYLKTHAIKPLFMLYKAIKHQTEKGPVDAVTAEARYSLHEDRLLREKTEARNLSVYLISSQNESREPVVCRMLDCDTITQAKEKALDAIYMNTPFSKRPSVHDLDLVWVGSKLGTRILRDEDDTSLVVKSWKRLNTLAHYKVCDGATMALQPRQSFAVIASSCSRSSYKNGTSRHHNGRLRKSRKLDTSHGSLSCGLTTPIFPVEDGSRVYHLTRYDDGLHNVGRSQKVISEIFLTRLLATKCTLQQYVDDMFSTILRVDNSLPPAVRFLFNFLDSAATRRNIVDPEVVHTWKSNSLLLRFWVNIIKNPEFVFDVNKSHIVDCCLSVVAQTFMDSCSTHEQQLGKDSPSSKLLYAKDIPKYRRLVSEFYSGVQQMPAVSELEMSLLMSDISTMYATDLNVNAALRELFAYSRQYRMELLEALGDDSASRRLQLGCRFEQLFTYADERSLYC